MRLLARRSKRPVGYDDLRQAISAIRRLDGSLPKRQSGFEFSKLIKVTLGEGDDAVETRACVATYHDERVGVIVRGEDGRYFANAIRDGEGDDAEPTGLLADHDGAVLTTRKGTSYDALVALIRAGSGFPVDEEEAGEADAAETGDES